MDNAATSAVKDLTRRSLVKAWNLFSRTAFMITTGVVLCASSAAAWPIGSLLISVGFTWSIMIRDECRKLQFFCSKLSNYVWASLLREEVPAAILLIITLYQVISIRTFFAVWVVPLLVAKLQVGFKAQNLNAIFPEIGPLVSSFTSHVQLSTVPLYNLSGIISNLRAQLNAQIQDNGDTLLEKVRVARAEIRKISQSNGFMGRLVHSALSPCTVLVRDLLLWERRAIFIYIASVLIIVLAYFKLHYVSWIPLLLPVCLLGKGTSLSRILHVMDYLIKKDPFIEDERVMMIDEAEEKENEASQFEPSVLAAEDYLHDAELNVPMIKRMNWPMCIYIGLIHVLSVVWLFAGNVSMWQTKVFALVLWPVGGLGITAGAHRLWAHRSFKASTVLRLVLMIFNSIANQGTIFHWSRDHRTHHIFSDTLADPYDATRGFFFSHCGWLLVRKHSHVVKASRKFVNVDDLVLDGFVSLQKKLDPFWNFFWCFVFPSFVAWYGWNESLISGLALPGLVRYVFLLHCTWSVNSIVHKWGPKPYHKPPQELSQLMDCHEDKSKDSTFHRENTTTESPLVSFLAIGEGWHSWHHAFPWDYATSELGCLQQYNPTKAFIDLMNACGLAYKCKRALKAWELRKQTWLAAAMRHGYRLSESLGGLPMFRVRTISLVREEESCLLSSSLRNNNKKND